MSTNQFIPDEHEQAQEILEILRDNDFDIDPAIEPDDIVDTIDPDDPVSVNLKRVAEGFEGTL